MSKKIAVFLPIGYDNSLLKTTKNIIKMLMNVSEKENFSIVFSYLNGYYNIELEFLELLNLGVEIRETKWNKVSQDEVKITLEYLQIKKDILEKEYLLPFDGIKNFMDCDFWLLMSDKLELPIAPVKPYGVIINNYIQRYIPEIYSSHGISADLTYLQTARNANIVLCTTPQTREDAIQYAGISQKKCLLTPLCFTKLNPSKEEFFKEEFEYFIWPTSAMEHKNHLNALSAIEMYFREFSGKMKVIITGTKTDLFQKDCDSKIPYIVEVIDKIKQSRVLSENLVILGDLDEKEYYSVLKKAKFLFHPVLYDNGTFSVIEAAYIGVPSLSSDYPQMKYINKCFELQMNFFNARDIVEIAKQLKMVETNHLNIKKNLPLCSELEKFTVEKRADKFWQIVRKYI